MQYQNNFKSCRRACSPIFAHLSKMG